MREKVEKARELHIGSRAGIIGERIKELREEKKWSLSQLGIKVNLGKSTLANYESGYRYPAVDKLEVLAKVLGTSTDYLLGLTESKRTKDNRDLQQYLENEDLVYGGEPLTNEQIETLNNLLSTFILNNKVKSEEKE